MIYTTDIIGDQWKILIGAVELGLVIGGCYDILRVLRVAFSFGKRLYILSDYVFCLWGGFLTFSFLLNENYGIPRLYIFLGEGAGAIFWYLTVGRIAVPLGRFLRRIISPFGKIFRKIGKNVEKSLNKAKKSFEKAVDKKKRLLKKGCRLVYNVLCLNISKAFSFCGGKAGKEPEKVESNGAEKTEKGNFPESGSYCLRGISSDFSDLDAIEHQQEKERA